VEDVIAIHSNNGERKKKQQIAKSIQTKSCIETKS
jgi:hypothetical protein